MSNNASGASQEELPTWKCSCPGTVLWGNSGRNMETKPGRLHSALSLSGPTAPRPSTCSGMEGALSWSIRRWPRRRAEGARRHRPAGRDRPTLERNPRQPEEHWPSSCSRAGLYTEGGRQWFSLVWSTPPPRQSFRCLLNYLQELLLPTPNRDLDDITILLDRVQSMSLHPFCTMFPS